LIASRWIVKVFKMEDIVWRPAENMTAVYQPIMLRMNAFVDAGDLHWEGSTGVYLRLRRERFVGRDRAALLIEGLVLRDLDTVVSNPEAVPRIVDALKPDKGELLVSKKDAGGWVSLSPDDAQVPGFPGVAKALADAGFAGHLRISDNLCFVKMKVDGVEFDMRFAVGWTSPDSVLAAYDRASLVMDTVRYSNRAYIEAAWACKRVIVYDTVMNTKIRPRQLTCGEALAIAFVQPASAVAPDMSRIVHAYALQSQIMMNGFIRNHENMNRRDDPAVNAFIKFFATIKA
jgi:hypothetical protein